MLQFTVNEKFKFDIENSASIDVSALNTTTFHVLKDNKSFDIEVVETDFNSNIFVLKVNGNIYEVKAKDELEQLLSKMGIDSTSGLKVNELKAPMPGAVVSVEVEVGQEVAKGDALIILEAMKMENILKSPTDGVIKEIKVAKGQNIDKNTILIVFE